MGSLRARKLGLCAAWPNGSPSVFAKWVTISIRHLRNELALALKGSLMYVFGFCVIASILALEIPAATSGGGGKSA